MLENLIFVVMEESPPPPPNNNKTIYSTTELQRYWGLVDSEFYLINTKETVFPDNRYTVRRVFSIPVSRIIVTLNVYYGSRLFSRTSHVEERVISRFTPRKNKTTAQENTLYHPLQRDTRQVNQKKLT